MNVGRREDARTTLISYQYATIGQEGLTLSLSALPLPPPLVYTHGPLLLL